MQVNYHPINTCLTCSHTGALPVPLMLIENMFLLNKKGWQMLNKDTAGVSHGEVSFSQWLADSQ